MNIHWNGVQDAPFLMWLLGSARSLAHLLTCSLVAGNTENQEAKSDEGNPPLLSVKKTSEINRVLLDASERVSE